MDSGQDPEVFASKMHHTLKSLASDMRFDFGDIFDTTLPESPAEGSAATKVAEVLQKVALRSGSSNVFVDTSTSSAWEHEYSEGVTTCIRPSHSIFSTKLNRYLTVAELFRAQGLFKQDFKHPDAIDAVLERPREAQDLCGNSFASTCAQAQLLCSLVHAEGWKHIGTHETSGIMDAPLSSPAASKQQPTSTCSPEATLDSQVHASTCKRKLGVESYFEPVDYKRSKFPAAKAASGLPHQACGSITAW